MSEIPYDADAERGLIGAALIDGSIPTAVDIEPDDFYIERHKTIWSSMQRLAASNDLDAYTLSRDLNKRGVGDDISEVYIAELLSDATSILRADPYAETLREFSTRRRLLAVANRIAKDAFASGDLDPGKYIDDLMRVARVSDGAVHWSSFLSDAYDEIAERYNNPVDTWGIPTGFSSFDYITGGLQQGESMLLGGAPERGKSILAVQFTEGLARSAPGALYSMEMTGKALSRRAISSASNVDTRKIKTGNLDNKDWDAIAVALERLDSLPVYMSDRESWTTTALRADLARLKAQRGIKFFVIDYLVLLADKGDREPERIAMLSRSIKQICRHLDLAGVSIHSLVKSGLDDDSGEPKLSDFRGEAGVSFDADLAVMLTSFTPMSENERVYSQQDRAAMRTLWFVKGRELANPRKYIHLRKADNFPKFAELARSEE